MITIQNLVNPYLWPWLIDSVIGLVSLILFIYLFYIGISNRQIFESWDTWLSLITALYSISNAFRKWNNDQKEKLLFSNELITFFQDCKSLIIYHLPDSESLFPKIEQKVISTHFDDWKKYQNIPSIEYQIINSYIYHFSSSHDLEVGDRLLLKYLLVTNKFPLHFPLLVDEMKQADYLTTNSPYNEFIRKLYDYLETNSPLCELSLPEIDSAAIEETINIAFQANYSEIKSLLQEKEKRNKVDFLLKKCFENAYTTAGNLISGIRDNSSRQLVLLYKYDERFSIQKRKWRSKIYEKLKEKYATIDRYEEKVEEVKKKLDNIIMPYPFSRALSFYDYCVEKMAKNDHFSFVIYPDKFKQEEFGWSVEKFIKERIIPKAYQFQDEINQNLISEFPYLKGLEKTTFDANYYIFYFTRSDFSAHATPDAIPTTIRNFLIDDILDSEDAGNIIASQLIYLKQVINNLTLSGLLFTEDRETQEKIRRIEKRLINSLKKKDILIKNIYDLASIGNQFDEFVKQIHKLLFNKDLQRKYGKKYEESKYISQKIINNAKEIIEVFRLLNMSDDST